MKIELAHVVVPADNEQTDAAFFAKLVGLQVSSAFRPFISFSPIWPGCARKSPERAPLMVPVELSFIVDDEMFDSILEVLQREHFRFFSDRTLRNEGQINYLGSGRSVFVATPSKHRLEFVNYGPARDGIRSQELNQVGNAEYTYPP